MSTSKFVRILLSATLVGLVAPSFAAPGSRWMLMSRHGDCAEIATLKRKIPDLGEISDPYSFMELMRQRGHQVNSSEISGARGNVEVNVPEKELFLIFVAPGFCENTSAR